MEQKTKRQRFESVGGSRVQMVLDKLNNLSKCANSRNYQYDQKDIDKMFKAINDEVRRTKMKFEDDLNTGSGAKKVFKF